VGHVSGWGQGEKRVTKRAGGRNAAMTGKSLQYTRLNGDKTV